MKEITNEQYEYALARVEALLPLVDDDMPANSPLAVELSIVSDVVMEYEKLHFPIAKPGVAELIAQSMRQMGMTQQQLAGKIGISPARVSDYITGRAVPTLQVAGQLCASLNIQPAAMLGL